MTTLTGWSHVGVSVTDLDRAVAWYRDVLGFAVLFPYDTEAFDRRILRHPTGAVLGLTRHRGTPSTGRFDPTVVGLDHLSFRVDDVDTLTTWLDHLDALGVAHHGVQRHAGTGSALIAFRDPDGLQIELYVQVVPPARLAG